MVSVYFNHQIIGTCYWKSNFTDHVQCDKYKGNSAAVHGPTAYNHLHVPVYVCSFYLLSRQAVQVDYLLFKKFKVFMRIECQEDRTPYGVVKTSDVSAVYHTPWPACRELVFIPHPSLSYSTMPHCIPSDTLFYWYCIPTAQISVWSVLIQHHHHR